MNGKRTVVVALCRLCMSIRYQFMNLSNYIRCAHQRKFKLYSICSPKNSRKRLRRFLSQSNGTRTRALAANGILFLVFLFLIRFFVLVFFWNGVNDAMMVNDSDWVTFSSIHIVLTSKPIETLKVNNNWHNLPKWTCLFTRTREMSSSRAARRAREKEKIKEIEGKVNTEHEIEWKWKEITKTAS